MNWRLATDTELITVIQDRFASSLDVANAAEEYLRRHPHSNVYSIVQYKIKEAQR
jgi:hypothetical protein